MSIFIYTVVFFFVVRFEQIRTDSIPTIRNAFLQPAGYSRRSSLNEWLNRTCKECLCRIFAEKSILTGVALNCFPNQTCQIFDRFPKTYQIESFIGAKLYFPQKIFPNKSSCCQPNFTDLFDRLQATVPDILNLSINPTAFGYDERKENEVVVIGATAGPIIWFNPFDLTFKRNFSSWTSFSIEIHDDLLLSSVYNVPTIHVFNRSTMNLLTNITFPTLTQTRRYLFFNQTRLLIATSQSNRSLTVFDVLSSSSYQFKEILRFPPSTCHSLVKVNDTFFYASAWTSALIYSYFYRNGMWNSSLFNNGTTGMSGSHMKIDDCGRIWQVIFNFGLFIYDPSGIRLATWNMSLNGQNIYDLLLLPSYMILVSRQSLQSIFRYDPQIFC